MTPGRDDDPRDSGERPKKSWREIDASRDRARSRAPSERRPAGPAAEARAAAAAQQYLRTLEGSLFAKKGGAEADRLGRAVREAHGTPGFEPACRAYLDALGVPADLGLVTLFLDLPEPGLLCSVLDALSARAHAGDLTATSGLGTQIRLLSQSADDDVAERSEEILARL